MVGVLRQYAVGFSFALRRYRRYVVHNKVIANPGVAYELIDLHVILCMMRLRNTYHTSYEFSKFMGKLGSLIPKLDSAAVCLLNL